MKRHWKVARQLLEDPKGEQRWDQAYQLLLHWAGEQEVVNSPKEEVETHACSALRPGIESTPGRTARD